MRNQAGSRSNPVMDRYLEMAHTDSPVLGEDLSMGTDEHSLTGGCEDDDY